MDLTNFLTIDSARPLHVFDADKLNGNLVVRKALPGEKIDLRLISPNVFTFIFLHHSGDDGVMEVQIISEYDESSSAMNKAVALSMPSLYITGFVIYRLLRLSQNGRNWYDSTPSHAWEEE